MIAERACCRPADLETPPTTTTTTRMYEDCVLQSMRFPQKLWKIVNECETGAIRWGANGDTILLDYKRFQVEYLEARRPIFKTTNIASFIRQLNLYGFRKVTYSHNRDPACSPHNPYVHEFLHESFRADRTDLLAKVCRKASASKSKCFPHDYVKSAEDSPEKKCSRLKLCQLALTKTLKDITEEYRRKQEEKLTIVGNNTLNRINPQNIVAGLPEIEFERVSNWSSTIESSIKYSPFPLSTNGSFEPDVSSWRIVTLNKKSL